MSASYLIGCALDRDIPPQGALVQSQPSPAALSASSQPPPANHNLKPCLPLTSPSALNLPAKDATREKRPKHLHPLVSLCLSAQHPTPPFLILLLSYFYQSHRLSTILSILHLLIPHTDHQPWRPLPQSSSASSIPVRTSSRFARLPRLPPASSRIPPVRPNEPIMLTARSPGAQARRSSRRQDLQQRPPPERACRPQAPPARRIARQPSRRQEGSQKTLWSTTKMTGHSTDPGYSLNRASPRAKPHPRPCAVEQTASTATSTANGRTTCTPPSAAPTHPASPSAPESPSPAPPLPPPAGLPQPQHPPRRSSPGSAPPSTAWTRTRPSGSRSTS